MIMICRVLARHNKNKFQESFLHWSVLSNKRLCTYVVNAGDFGWVELFVVAAAGCEVEPSAAYPADEQAVVDGELDDTVEGLLPRLQ